MKSLMTTTLATFAFAAATTAQASVIEIDLGLDGPISNGTVNVDLYGAPTLVDGTFVLSAPDGIADMTFFDSTMNGISTGGVEAPFGVETFFSPGTPESGSVGRYTGVRFATAPRFSRDMVAFNLDDDISSFDGGWAVTGEFYSGDAGALSTIGDRGLFGFRVEYVEVSMLPMTFDECLSRIGDRAFCETDHDFPREQVLATFYGFMDITRGSIGINTLAINTTSGAPTLAGVTPPPVPLPAAGWMLLAGFGGLVAMKRRKAA